MQLGIGMSLTLPLNALGEAAFTPASLSPAAWYDPSDLTSMFQNSNGTTAAVVDSPVGYIADKSGNGKHLTQADNVGRRPLLRQSGALYYLEYDGTDDVLYNVLIMAQPWERISSIRQITWTLNDVIYHGGVGGGAGNLYQNATTPDLRIYDGGAAAPINSSAAVGADVVISEIRNGANSGIAVNSGAYVMGDTGTVSTVNLSVGAEPPGTGAANIRWYGAALVGRTLTADERTDLREYMAGKAGVTL